MRIKFPVSILLWVILLSLAACSSGSHPGQSSPAPSVPDSIARLSDPPSSVPSSEEEAYAPESAPQSERSGVESIAIEPAADSPGDPDTGSSAPAAAGSRPQPGMIRPAGEPEASAIDDAVENGAVPPVLAHAAMTSSGDASLIETELLRLMNDERTANGVEVLGVVEAMQFAARIRAQEALESLSHIRPDGTPYHTAFDEAGFSYAGKWHGENLAIIRMEGGAPDEVQAAAAIFRELMESAGHHKNILSDNFYQAGVGIYIRQDETSLQIGAAQLFAGL